MKKTLVIVYNNLKKFGSKGKIAKKRMAINTFLILYISALLYILYTFVATSSLREIPPVAFFVFFAVSLVLFILLRSVFFTFSNYVFVGIFFALTTYIVWQWGVNVPIGILFYVLIIIISGILLSPRFSFVMAGASSVVVFVIGYLQLNMVIESNLSLASKSLELPDIFVYPVIFGIVSTLSWFSTFQTEKILLDQKHELLESESKKITELYRMAEFGKLSSGFFHDLINPLTAISLNIDKMKNSKSDKVDETRFYLNNAVSATRDMENFLISVRKQLARKAEKENFSLIAEIFQATRILSYKAREKNITIKFLPLVDIKTYGDSVKFGQVAMNLIANAIDAYEEIDDTVKKEVLVQCLCDEDDIVFIVEDHGVGVSHDLEKKVFEPFFTTKNKKKGIGMGLFLVKDIVEKEFEGNIEVISKKGQGTEFIVRFLKK